MTKQELFNTVLVHTARTWERVRLEQPNQELPYDNIESVNEIVQITDSIMENPIVAGFIDYNGIDYFVTATDMLGDTFIEQLAHAEIQKLLY